MEKEDHELEEQNSKMFKKSFSSYFKRNLGRHHKYVKKQMNLDFKNMTEKETKQTVMNIANAVLIFFFTLGAIVYTLE